jgi:dipeptidyl aminopeptidase/acylaminoacyl peptidase
MGGQPSEETAVAFSPDGQWLALASEDRTVKLWNVADGQQLRTFEGHSGGGAAVAFSPDGQWLAGGAGQAVKIWDVATGQGLFTLTGHTDFVRGMAFSRDGTRLASVSRDRTVRLWDVTKGRLIHTFEGGYYQTKLAFSPDGARLAIVATDRGIELRDVRTFQLIRTFEGNTAVTRALAFTPDGKRLASTSIDGRVKLWDVETGQEALLLPGRNRGARDVVFSRDGTRLATGDGDVKFWDARPWTPKAAIEREALGLLDSLFAMPLCKIDVLDYLRNAPTIRPQARQWALSLVDRYHEETKPETYHRASWALVRQPYLNAFQYRFALLQAEHACRLLPGKGKFMTTLGAAYYRAGHHREAIEALEKADRLDQDSPAALAFRAMAHHRLGQHEPARADFARLRALLDQPHRAKDAEALDLMREAEALIAPPRATTER